MINNTLKPSISFTPISQAAKSVLSKYNPSSNSFTPTITPKAPVTTAPVSTQANPVRTGTIAPPVNQNSLSTALNNAKTQLQGIQTGINGLMTPPKVVHVSQGTQQNPSSGFQGYVQGTAQAAQPTGTQQDIVKTLQEEAQRNKDIAQHAQNIADLYGGQIAKIGNLGAGAVAGDLSTGTNVVGEGNAAIASQSASQRMQALSQAEQAALQGTSQGLTGQQQVTNALNQALGGANTQQAQQITGLNNAATLAQPSVASYGQTVFNPLTGQYGGGGGNLDPQQVANDLATRVKSGQLTYEQAVQSLGYAGNAGQQFLNQALGPNFNAPQSTANIAGTAAGTQNVASTGGQIQASQQQQIAAYKSAQQQGQNLASQLDDLITTFGLNPSNLNAANIGLQKIAQNTSSPQYQILSNYINDVASRYAQVLTPPGGSATDTTRAIATGMLNSTASGESIKQVLQSLDQQASAVIAGVPATGSIPNQQTAPQTSGGGQKVTAGGYNFVLQNGKWVAE